MARLSMGLLTRPACSHLPGVLTVLQRARSSASGSSKDASKGHSHGDRNFLLLHSAGPIQANTAAMVLQYIP